MPVSIFEQLRQLKANNTADDIFASTAAAYLERTLPAPGFSSYTEIVIECLCDGWMCEPVDYITHRYQLAENVAYMAVDRLRLIRKIYTNTEQ